MTTRLQIEQYLLGCMLMDASTVAIAVDVLKPNNFSAAHAIGRFKTGRHDSFGISHADVYTSILALYPSRSVNILGVTRQLQQTFDVKDVQPLRYCVAILTDTIGGTGAFEEYSFILVQESIKDALAAWVNQKVAQAQKEVEHVTAGAEDPRVQREQDFAQIRHRLQLMPDVFDQVDALRTFFHNYGYQDELAEVEEMASNINGRTRQIREKRFRTNQLSYVRHLAKQCNYQEAAEQLIDAALQIIDGTVHPNPKLINHINQITAIS